MPAPALMTMAMPAITAKAANRLPLIPHCGRKNLEGQPSLAIVNRTAMLPRPARSLGSIVRRQYQVTRLTKSGKFDGFAQFLRVETKKSPAGVYSRKPAFTVCSSARKLCLTKPYSSAWILAAAGRGEKFEAFARFLRTKSKRAGARPALPGIEIRFGSILRNQRATPVEAIVDAGLHGMLVVSGAAESREDGWRHKAGLAEIVVLIFDLGRPVLGEHVFQAGADGEAVVMAAVERERLRHGVERQRVVAVGEGIA